jgi:hypothetical protein
MRNVTVAAVVIAFALAMAYLEAAVVVYLQHALGITPDSLFPLRSAAMVGDFATIEVGREFATLVMLAAAGWLAGRNWIDRLAWTAVAFGAWDIAYYGWLWVFIGWPHSPLTWDVLFLIPVPWAGPVWAPVAVSVALIGFGLAAAREVSAGPFLRVAPWHVALAVAGGIVVVVSFTLDGPSLMNGSMPAPFAWPVFVAGMAMAAAGAGAALRGMRSATGRSAAS